MKLYMKGGSNNLIPYPYTRTSGYTHNGITYTVNSDGSVTANGTATGNSTFALKYDMELPAGKTFTLSGNSNRSDTMVYTYLSKNGAWYKEYYNESNPVTFTTEESCVYSFCIRVNAGAVLENVKFYPMLNKGTTAKPYEKYREYTQVKLLNGSRNLIPYPYYDASLTNNGITYTVNNNGTVTANGTATGGSQFRFLLNGTFPIGTYTLSCGGEHKVRIAKNGAWYKEGEECQMTVDNASDKWTFYILFAAGTVLENVIFYPMLNKGRTALPYDKYFPLSYMDVYFKSRNLIPYVNSIKNYAGVDWIVNQNGSVTVEGMPTGYSAITFEIPVEYGQTYTFSCGGILNSMNLGADINGFDEGRHSIEAYKHSNTTTSTTFTITDERVSYITVAVKRWNNNPISATIYPMLNEGDKALPYEQPQQYPN